MGGCLLCFRFFCASGVFHGFSLATLIRITSVRFLDKSFDLSELELKLGLHKLNDSQSRRLSATKYVHVFWIPSTLFAIVLASVRGVPPLPAHQIKFSTTKKIPMYRQLLAAFCHIFNCSFFLSFHCLSLVHIFCCFSFVSFFHFFEEKTFSSCSLFVTLLIFPLTLKKTFFFSFSPLGKEFKKKHWVVLVADKKSLTNSRFEKKKKNTVWSTSRPY